MAKDQNKKGKFSKQPINMQLIQNIIAGKVLSDEEKERNYQNFRERAEGKSAHLYRDLGEKPLLLRLHLSGTIFDSTQEMLVKVKSFRPLMRQIGDEQEEEIGFEVHLKSPLTPGKTHRLEVLRKQHKATLYISL